MDEGTLISCPRPESLKQKRFPGLDPVKVCSYVVVQFEPTGELSSDSSIAVVPASWIMDDECKWPSNNKNINSLIKKRKGPAPDWKSFPIEKIIGICDTYDRAREKEKRYALTSNSENEEVLGKGCRKKYTTQIFTRDNPTENCSGSSSDENTEDVAQELNMLQKQSKQISHSVAEIANVSNDFSDININSSPANEEPIVIPTPDKANEHRIYLT
ncbi:hypothetical protein FQR65_LT11855 [Abscondita terminalis]|nr:hypothetical protein FQR65_LT11855 [Abscondita terminalis]